MTGLLDHLERQVISSQRLLQSVLAQRDAIRRQDTEALLARLGDIQAEMANRVQLEQERDGLLVQAGARLGVPPDALDLDAMLALVDPVEAERARAKSAELRGLIAEIGRVHGQNRVLLRQELSFLDHLLRVLSGEPQGGYTVGGWSSVPQSSQTVDARA